MNSDSLSSLFNKNSITLKGSLQTGRMAEKEKEAGASAGQGLDDQELQVRVYRFSRKYFTNFPTLNNLNLMHLPDQ